MECFTFMKSITLILMLMTFSLSVAAVELSIPEEFVVVRVNGEEYSASLLSTETVVDLNVGQNVLVLKYAQMFDDDTEDHHITVKSKPFILLFSVPQLAELVFSYPKQNDSQSARVFAEGPLVDIVDDQGNKLAIINQSLANYNDTIMKETITRRQQIVKKSLEDNDKGQFIKTAPQSLEMLKYWWHQASEKEQSEFLEYLENTNN